MKRASWSASAQFITASGPILTEEERAETAIGFGTEQPASGSESGARSSNLTPSLRKSARQARRAGAGGGVGRRTTFRMGGGFEGGIGAISGGTGGPAATDGAAFLSVSGSGGETGGGEPAVSLGGAGRF